MKSRSRVCLGRVPPHQRLIRKDSIEDIARDRVPAFPGEEIPIRGNGFAFPDHRALDLHVARVSGGYGGRKDTEDELAAVGRGAQAPAAERIPTLDEAIEARRGGGLSRSGVSIAGQRLGRCLRVASFVRREPAW